MLTEFDVKAIESGGGGSTIIASWWNVTRGVKTTTLPPGAIVCPPSGRSYYESDDPQGLMCLKLYAVQPPPVSPPPPPNTGVIDDAPPPSIPAVPGIEYTPLLEPANTFRASTVLEMYEFVPSLKPTRWKYKVGEETPNVDVQHYLRNKTQNAVLEVIISAPDYVRMVIPQQSYVTASEGSVTFRISPNAIIPVTIGMSTDGVKSRSLVNPPQRNVLENVVVDVYPIDVIGPIYVYTNLPPIGQDPTGPNPEDLVYYNATQGIYTATVPSNAIICPPGGTTYYEFGDEDGPRCLRSWKGAAPPEPTPTPTTPPPPTSPSPSGGGTTDSSLAPGGDSDGTRLR